MKSWERYVVIASLAAGLTGGSLAWGQSDSTAPPPASSAPAPDETAAGAAVKININTADEAVLTEVKGIGKSKAKAIIAYRDKNGPFKTVDELTKVKGIKEKSLSKFKDQLTAE
jgi:competence protein ComEA